MKNLLLGLFTIVLLSCNSDDDTIENQDFLVFGHFYGFCGGENCIETFKLTDTVLFEDTVDDYTRKSMNFIALDNEKFEQVKNLTDSFPDQLLNENERSFGCPDCADGGGLFIQISKNGVLKSWVIDQDKDQVPAYLHSFIDKVNQKIVLINE